MNDCWRDVPTLDWTPAAFVVARVLLYPGPFDEACWVLVADVAIPGLEN